MPRQEFFAIRPREGLERSRREDGLNLTELLYEFEYGEFAENNQNETLSPTPKTFQELSHDDQLAEKRMKKLRGALNKMTADNFYTHLYEIQDHLSAFSYHLMKMFVEFMVHKAVYEDIFCPMYAYTCKTLSSIQLLEEVNGQVMDFGQLVLDEVENVFGYARCSLNWISDDSPTEEERSQITLKEDKKRRILLGITRFICELFKAQFVSIKEFYDFIRRLEKDKNEKCVESLCKLIIFAGKELSKSVQSNEELQQEWNYTWIRIGNLINENSLSPRLKFMLQDVVELKNSNWVPRRPLSRPKTKREIEFEEWVTIHDSSSARNKRLKHDPIVVLAEAKFTQLLSENNAFDQIITWMESNKNMNKPPYLMVYALTSSIVKHCIDDGNLNHQKFNDLIGLLKRYCDTRMTQLACLNSVYNSVLQEDCSLVNLERIFSCLHSSGVVSYMSLLHWRDSWGSDPGLELKDKGWANLTLAPFFYNLSLSSIPSVLHLDLHEIEFLSTNDKLTPEIFRGFRQQPDPEISLLTN